MALLNYIPARRLIFSDRLALWACTFAIEVLRARRPVAHYGSGFRDALAV